MATITGEWCHNMWGAANSQGMSQTVDFDFPPGLKVVKVALTNCMPTSLSGYVKGYVLNYRRRLANNTDTTVNFLPGAWHGTTAWALDPQMTHATVGLDAVSAWGQVLVTVEHWT